MKIEYSVRVSTVVEVSESGDGSMRWRVELFDGDEKQAAVTDSDLGAAFREAYLVALHVKAEES